MGLVSKSLQTAKLPYGCEESKPRTILKKWRIIVK